MARKAQMTRLLFMQLQFRERQSWAPERLAFPPLQWKSGSTVLPLRAAYSIAFRPNSALLNPLECGWCADPRIQRVPVPAVTIYDEKLRLQPWPEPPAIP